MPTAQTAPFGSVPRRRRTGSMTGGTITPDPTREVGAHPKFGGEDMSLPSPTARLDSLVMAVVEDMDGESSADPSMPTPSSAGGTIYKGASKCEGGNVGEAINGHGVNGVRDAYRPSSGPGSSATNYIGVPPHGRGPPLTPGASDCDTRDESMTGRARSRSNPEHTHAGTGGGTRGGSGEAASTNGADHPTFARTSDTRDSPPISPSQTAAAAAVAAAASARADTNTWISGEGSGEVVVDDEASGLKVSISSETLADDDGQDGSPSASGSRRSQRRRSANPRFEPYCTATKGPIELAMKSTAKKRVDLGPSPASLIDQERKFESVLGKLEARLGKNHPEMGKALLQIARHCFARNRKDKAEEYLKRSWDVFKYYADRTSNLNEVYDSFLLLFEDYECSQESMEALRQDMCTLSPHGEKIQI
mmetsp:Transcript_21026/g.40180  ORF Transcript_21026/g.40180 Transcript_21026/m.40180 type:complete len:421 (+) Transcript_21026:251-1513(+)